MLWIRIPVWNKVRIDARLLLSGRFRIIAESTVRIREVAYILSRAWLAWCFKI